MGEKITELGAPTILPDLANSIFAGATFECPLYFANIYAYIMLPLILLFQAVAEAHQLTMSDLAAKICILGDGAVGKTSLCSNLRTRRIPGKYELTVGLNIEVHNTQLEDTLVKLVLWDLAGQERWGSVRPAFYYGARVALIVFDLQNRGSFFDVRHWVRELHSHSPDTPFILCGNKRDLRKREVSIEEAEELALDLSAPYFETSALRGENVQELFQKATQMALQGSAVAY